ncbi:MAG: AAA family ATPase, partial [Micromonosporaceae bacterium]|nr:AAA family ATPase [Micromonosporaceae bacterium]
MNSQPHPAVADPSSDQLTDPLANPGETRPREAGPPQADLAAERAHLSASRAALARMRDRTTALFATGDRVAGDAYASESLGRALARRLAELADDPDTPLFFGRLDHAEPAGAAQAPGDPHEHVGAAYHIGRRHVVDDVGEPMVLDWRAPVSQAFYQASVKQPMGVARRRRFGYTGGELTGFEDEHLAAGEELGTASRILTEEIERPRVGPMRDIVATIQPEQDDLVRAALQDSICVQGAPGTGKTAVGLHRAAYLLYTYRERLRKAGVLVVGPSRAFLSYISNVLPALGEIDIDQLTVDELVGHVAPRAEDTPEGAAVKHDPRMADVVRRALYAQLHDPAEPLVVPDGSSRWRVPVEPLRRIVAEVRGAVVGDGLPYQTGRDRLRARVVALLQRMAEARGESPGEAWQRRMARATPVKALLDHVWPAVRPAGLIASLLSDATLLARAADGILSPAEQSAIAWARPRTAKTARWTTADAVLIDEALGLIERLPSYGHIVVDEAQDLSPMQCRAIARRTGHGSLTVLGDLAQGTAPWAARRWRDSLEHLGKPGAELTALTTGFRVPDAVVALANRLLPHLAVDVPEAVSLRRDGALTIRSAALLPEVVREALRHEGSVAVIAADAALPGLRARLGDADERVTLLPASLAKGLEYDHVIVVEPAEIVAAEPRGLHRLYVVLTRAVSRLDVL